MLRYSGVVFDDTVHDTASVYTASAYNSPLGLGDKLTIQAIVDQVAASTGPRVTVQMEHSADGVHWSNKAGTPEINALGTPAGQTTYLSGYERGAIPSLCYVRLRLQLTGTGPPTPQAHLKLIVTARDT